MKSFTVVVPPIRHLACGVWFSAARMASGRECYRDSGNKSLNG